MAPAQAADKPNILVIWGDDIGVSNISAYSRGMMGFFAANAVVLKIANANRLSNSPVVRI